MKETGQSLDYLSSYSMYPAGLLSHVKEVLLNNSDTGFILSNIYLDPFYAYHLEQQIWRTPSYDPLCIVKSKTGSEF